MKKICYSIILVALFIFISLSINKCYGTDIPTQAILVDGATFNIRVKKLVNNTNDIQFTGYTDNKVKKIVFTTINELSDDVVDNLEELYNEEKYVDLADNYPLAILAFFDEESGTVFVIANTELNSEYPFYMYDNARAMFQRFSALEEIVGFERIDTSGIHDSSYMFCNCTSLKNVDLSKLNLSNAYNFKSMFNGCKSMTSIDTRCFENICDDLYVEVNMYGVFANCSSLTAIDVSMFNTAKVTDMAYMFYECSKLENLDLSNFNATRLQDMEAMFYGCRNLKNISLDNFYTYNVTNMSWTFFDCSSLEELNLNSFRTSNVKTMYAMFDSCKSLKELDINHFETYNVENMASMFEGMNNLTKLDIRNWSTRNVNDMSGMFSAYYYDAPNNDWILGENKLRTIIISEKWNTDMVTNFDDMFVGCNNLIGGFGKKWDENEIKGLYAKADTSNEEGYLTINCKIDIEKNDSSNNIDDSVELEFGENQNVIIKPNSGYMIISISDNGKEIQIDSNEEYIYEIEDINEYHKLIVNTKRIDAETIPNENINNTEKPGTPETSNPNNNNQHSSVTETTSPNSNPNTTIASEVKSISNTPSTGDKVLQVTIPTILSVIILNIIVTINVNKNKKKSKKLKISRICKR